MRLRLRNPVLLLPGDRFVLRQCSPAMTIGGGKVLDAHPLPKVRKSACLAWLESMRQASEEGKLLLTSFTSEFGGYFSERAVSGDRLHNCGN